MRLLLGSLLVPALLIAGAGSASAQAPSNDARAAAIQLAPRTTVTAHTDETTPPGTEPGENATCGNTQYDGTLWWWFTGDGKIMRVDTVEPATNYDTVVYLRSGSCTSAPRWPSRTSGARSRWHTGRARRRSTERMKARQNKPEPRAQMHRVSAGSKDVLGMTQWRKEHP